MDQKYWDRADKILRFLLQFALYALVVYTAMVDEQVR